MLGFLPTRAYRPGTPGATTFLSPLSGTFNYGWDSFAGLLIGRSTDDVWVAVSVTDHSARQISENLGGSRNLHTSANAV